MGQKIIITNPPGTGGGGISGLTPGQNVVAASATTVQTDGVKRYVALLTQSGTDAPVATVLENSLGGTVVWTRDATGIYTGTLAGAFTVNKTTEDSGVIPVDQVMWKVKRGSADTLEFAAMAAGDPSEITDSVCITILVYP